MQQKQYICFVPAPCQHLRRRMQRRSGTSLMQETHVLSFDEQLVPPALSMTSASSSRRAKPASACSMRTT